MAVVTLILLNAEHGRMCAQSSGISMTSADRLQDSGWWPTKGDAAATEYAPSGACLKCHAGHATPMSQASSRASETELLHQHSLPAFTDGTFTYLVKQNLLSVFASSGKSSEEIAWSFGNGQTGQTWLLEKDGSYSESRVSYYTSLQALDITTGHSPDAPGTSEEALGTHLSLATAQACFGCHTSMSSTTGVFKPAQAVAGVSCQACHGPGAAHIRAMKSPPAGTRREQDYVRNTIFNPASLSPSDSVDFCGACHRTWADVALNMPANLGVIAARFQPYRLEKSRCWGQSGDARITCVACHDPHQPLVQDLSTYNRNCLACHAAGVHSTRAKLPASVCKASTSPCVSCHMPKVLVPSAHASFTDHYIRVVSPGSAFPE